MKEFPSGGSNMMEQFFGYRLCASRMVIECAFGRLKAWFRTLTSVMDINLSGINISGIHHFLGIQGQTNVKYTR